MYIPYYVVQTKYTATVATYYLISHLLGCPDEPTDVQIFNVSSRSLTISWTKPYNNNDPITGYNISYQNPDCLVNVSNVTQNVTVSSEEEQVMITGLHPGEVYTFVIIAINNVCPSQISSPASIHTMEEGTYNMFCDDVKCMYVIT